LAQGCDRTNPQILGAAERPSHAPGNFGETDVLKMMENKDLAALFRQPCDGIGEEDHLLAMNRMLAGVLPRLNKARSNAWEE